MAFKLTPSPKKDILVLISVIPIALLVAASIVFIPRARMDFILGAARLIACALVVYVAVSLTIMRCRRIREAKRVRERAANIRAAADNVSSPDDDLTFEDLCEMMDDEDERDILFELGKMPPGKKRFSDAYKKVMADEYVRKP